MQQCMWNIFSNTAIKITTALIFLFVSGILVHFFCVFFLQVMLESSVYLTLVVYSGCCLLAAVASCFLPIETKGCGLQESSHREWGQEMVGKGSHSPGVTRSNSGSQEWWDMKTCWKNEWYKQVLFHKNPTLKHRKLTIPSLPLSCVKLQELLGWTYANCVPAALCSHS